MVQNDPGIVGYQDAELSIDGPTYVSWAVQNTLPSDVTRPFFVDLVLDDIVVKRWRVPSMRAGFFQQVRDWDELGQVVRPQPGPHTMKLVLDSTNLIPEQNETDNVIERPFTWTPPVQASESPPRTRLPDLRPASPEGWSGPIIATSYTDDTVNGPLSVDVPTYIRYAFRNAGLTSTPSDVWVHLYLDDVLVDRQVWSGVLAGSFGTRDEWSGLFEVTGVAPGAHTLRLVVDATDLVVEADEGNNSFEKEFEWAAGAVPPKPFMATPPAPATTAPPPHTLPNLVPGWRFGSDGPIVVSLREGTLLDDPLTVAQTAYVDFVVQNRSTVPAAGYEVDLFFDGRLLKTFEGFQSLSPGFLQSI
ncbi:MAG: CARDB domain-containing protein, partial [Dehalococcoidia bacterium]